jgi:redox-sensitive bicupin YhaK (pirin superfamily)
VAIWTIKMAPGARWTLPAALGQGTRRSLYFFKGQSVSLAGQALNQHAALELRADATIEMVNGEAEAEFLLLQGKPIAETVAQYGPFVMNTQTEIRQAMMDYQRTQFGGWPWPDTGPVHGRAPERFAKHPGGAEEKPPVASRV